MEAAIEKCHATCPLSQVEVTAWTKRLKLPGEENERRLQRLITYWYAQAGSLLSVWSLSYEASVRDYFSRQLALGHAPKEIVLPENFGRVDRWLPEIADRLMAIRSELLALPGAIDAALRIRFGDYEMAIASLGDLSRALNDVAGSWHRPHSGHPSLETDSWVIDLLVCAVEDFTGDSFPSPRSYKRSEEIALIRLLAGQLFPSATPAKINTMLRHFHKRRLDAVQGGLPSASGKRL